MDIQRLRNLTTGRLHTEIGCVYQDIEMLTGEEGVMTHTLSRACRALEPYLREKVPDPRFWEDVYDPTHVGEIEVPPMDAAAKAEFWKLYAAQTDPLAGKEVIVAVGDKS